MAGTKPGHDELFALRALESEPRPQSQFLNFQRFSFHGVSVSNRHCSQRSGGQWLRREVSLTGARSTMRGKVRLLWRVASLIISTYSGLSAITDSLAKEFLSASGQSAPTALTRRFQNASLSTQAGLKSPGLCSKALLPFPDIDEMPGDRRRRRHRRRHQMRGALKTLAAFEVAVRD